MTADEQGDLYQRALDIAVTVKRFRMQSYRSSTDEWISMDQGGAGHIWGPRATAVDAAAKCLAWTGLLGMPAMQVIDLQSGEVVWRLSDRYPEAGESIPLPALGERLARGQATSALAELRRRRSEHAETSARQASLFEAPEDD